MEFATATFACAFILGVVGIPRAMRWRGWRGAIFLVASIVAGLALTVGVLCILAGRGPWPTVALRFGGALGDLYYHLVRLGPIIGTALVLSVLASGYAIVLLRVRAPWRLAVTLPGAGILLASSVVLVLEIARGLMGLPLGPSPSMGFSGTVQVLTLEGVEDFGGLGITSRYFDLLHDSARIHMKAQRVTAYGGPQLSLKGISVRQAAVEFLQADAEPAILSLHSASPPEVPIAWAVHELGAQEYVIESACLGTPAENRVPRLRDLGSVETKPRCAHALLVFPCAVSASVNMDPVRTPVGRLPGWFRVASPSDLPSLLVTYQSDPVQGFEGGWSSLWEREAWPLLLDGDPAIYAQPVLWHGGPVREAERHRGQVDFRLPARMNAMLVITESAVADSIGSVGAGTYAFLLEGLSEVTVTPLSLGPDSPSEWGLLFERFAETDGMSVCGVSADGVAGSLTVGSRAEELPAPPNTLAVTAGERARLGIYLHDRDLVLVGRRGEWEAARLNRERLRPSWWPATSSDARAGIVGALLVFLLGVWVTHHRAIISGLRWLVSGPPEPGCQRVDIRLASGDVIEVHSGEPRSASLAGSPALLVSKGTLREAEGPRRVTNLQVPVSQVLWIEPSRAREPSDTHDVRGEDARGE